MTLSRRTSVAGKARVPGAGGDVYHSERGYVADVAPDDFDAVVIPGGIAPDRMRRSRAMIDFVRGMHDRNKPVAWICHAGRVAVSADIIRGRRVTSFASIRDDMVNAGGEWEDAEVVVDGNLISSRTPPDLPAFCRAIGEALGG